jgi:hypothetical protein
MPNGGSASADGESRCPTPDRHRSTAAGDEEIGHVISRRRSVMRKSEFVIGRRRSMMRNRNSSSVDGGR